MLTQLTIKNFGLIDHVFLDFTDQLNILTGETGAGKSILIEALRFVLGEKIQTFQLRDASQKCIVEAIFEPSTEILSQEIFADFAEGESSIIFQRILSDDGRSKAKVNGLSVTVGQLKKMASALIDFHGPHDHQLLFTEEQHLPIIDRLTDFGDTFKKYKDIYTEYNSLTIKLEQLQDLSKSRERDLDMLKHQLEELNQVALTVEDYEETEQEHTKINNAEKLYQHINDVLQILSNDDIGVETQISAAFRPMQSILQTDAHAERLFKQFESLQEQTSTLVGDLTNYADSLQFNPAQAQIISDKYSAYQNILRKYGPTIEDTVSFFNDAQTKYDALVDFEQNDATLRKDIASLKKDLTLIAKKITDKRKKTATTLKKTIEIELKELGFSHVSFEATFEKSDLNKNGADHIVFFISPNAGESLKPLAQIVSSGEAARIMLALKKALVHVDPVPVLIFDEIDAQIGGRLGTITGTKLKEIADIRQVILITHLPQIASFAQTHFKITKSVIDERAQTQVSPLNDAQRVEELAQMMSGEKQTAASLKHAQEMLTSAQI